MTSESAVGRAVDPLQPLTGPTRWRRVALTLTTVLSWAMVGDGAVETFLSGSPLRWWICAAVMFAAAVAGLAWRRSSRETRAVTPLILFLALVAATAWQPGGLTDGIVLFTASTERVLEVVTVTAIVVAAGLLARVRRIPLSLRCLAVLVAAVVVIAVTISMMAGVPFAGLMQSAEPRPWWHWLVAGVVGVPMIAALIHESGRAIARLRARSRAGSPYMQAATICLLVAGGAVMAAVMNSANRDMPVVSLDVNTGNGGAVLSVRAEDVFPIAPPAARDVASLFNAAVDRIGPGMVDAERSSFDPAAVVAQVGTDPALLFAWVRDQTVLVPYAGLLRGPAGVLIDRVGNSLDRAILLYALLRTAGHEARLARGELSSRQADELLSAAGGAFDRRDIDLAGSRPSVLPVADVDPAKIDTVVKWAAGHYERAASDAATRARSQASRIAGLLRADRIEVGAPATGHEVSALVDHWWVQLRRAESWFDLDPSKPEARPGDALASPTETAQPAQLTDLDRTLLHTLAVRLVIETWDDGRLEETVVLDQELLPAGLLGQRIVLRTIPVGLPTEWGESLPDSPDSVATALASQREWLPVLDIGSQRVSRYSFDEMGRLNDATLPAWAQAVMAGRVLGDQVDEGARRLGGRLGEMLGGAPGSSAGAPRRALTGVWIEYEVRRPGRPVQVVRRELVDLLGPAARAAPTTRNVTLSDAQRFDRALALTGETEILPLVGEMSPRFVRYLALNGLHANRELLRSAARDMTSGEAARGAHESAAPMPGPTYSLALMRTLWSRHRADVYLDQLNVFTYHRQARSTGDASFVVHEAYDIVANEVAVRWDGSVDAFGIRLEQGVLDTNVEAFLMGPDRAIDNVSDVFTLRERDADWVVVHHSDDPDLRNAELPEDMRARIMESVQRDAIVIAPARLESLRGRDPVAWWRIDPGSGSTLGIGDRGWGQSSTEYMLVLATRAIGLTGAIACFYVGARQQASTPRPNTASNARLALCSAGIATCSFSMVFAMVALGQPELALAGAVFALYCAATTTGGGIAGGVWGN